MPQGPPVIDLDTAWTSGLVQPKAVSRTWIQKLRSATHWSLPKASLAFKVVHCTSVQTMHEPTVSSLIAFWGK